MVNYLYNPDRKSKGQLIAEFVVRKRLLDIIMDDIESSSMRTPEQHYLLVGQRGTGKTTLLIRIKYAIEDAPALKDWLIPILFSEEQYNVGELANLWENVAQVLEDYHGFTGLYEEMERHTDKSNFEELCWDILESALDRKGKKLVLLIDNIGDLLKKIGEKEVRRLRELLQTKPQIRLIAGSPFYLESILDYRQPLFEFFKVIRLDGLTNEETLQLLLKLGDIYEEREKIERIIKETPARIETLRTLTGGVPRTIALMFNIFIEHEHDNSLKDLDKILDSVTPLYKHRMDDLPPQQQKIVDAVAKHWDPISVKDLKDKVRLESKVISAQLRQLEKNQVIQKMETGTKNHEYIIKERFFNIWYLMRYGRKDDRQRVIWLVRFLESWCTEEEIEQRVAGFIEAIKNKKITEHNLNIFAEVYTSLKNLSADSRSRVEENAPFVYGKNIKYTKEELNQMIQESFDAGDYERCIRLIVRTKLMTRIHEGLVISINSKMVKDTVEGKPWAKFLGDLLITNYTEKSNFNAAFQVFSTSFGYIKLSLIRAYLKDEEVEKALEEAKSYFEEIGSLMELIENIDFCQDLDFVSIPTIAILRMLYANGQIHSLKKMFSEGVVKNENRQVKLSEIFNPIYLALNSVGGEGEILNLAPEKEAIVRAVKSLITIKN